MTMKRHRTCARLLAAIVLGGLSAMSYGATPAQVDAALIKGKEFLYSQQKNGNWETVAQPDPAETGQSVKNGQFTGRTALALYALLAAGESPQDPRIAQAIDFLRKNDTVGTYALSFRIQAFAFLPKTAENRAFVNKDARKLLDGIQSKGDALAMWTTPLRVTSADLRCTVTAGRSTGCSGCGRQKRWASRFPGRCGSCSSRNGSIDRTPQGHGRTLSRLRMRPFLRRA